MLKNLFYEGMQWKTKAVIKGNFKKADHTRHGGGIKSQNIRGPYPNTRERPITFSKNRLVWRTNLTRSHIHGMPNGGLEEIRPLGILDQVYFLFTLTQGKGRRPRSILRSSGRRTNGNIPSLPGTGTSRRVIADTQRRRTTWTHDVSKQYKRNPDD